MMKQKGGALITLAVIGAIIAVVVMTLLSYANNAVTFEENINKFDRASAVTLSNYTLKIKEAAQIPDKYVDALRSMIKDTFSGRYGADGSQATMQWIQERNLPVDSSMFANLQTIIVSGRDEFKLSQDRKLEICTTYGIYTKKPINKFILSFMGYPNTDVADKCEVILDQTTIDTFKTKVAAPITL